LCGGGGMDRDINKCLKKCKGKKGESFLTCMAKCLGKAKGRKYCEENYCKILPGATECIKGNPCKIENPTVADCQNCCGIKYYCCLIFNPPGTPQARKCIDAQTKCHNDCDLVVHSVGGNW